MATSYIFMKLIKRKQGQSVQTQHLETYEKSIQLNSNISIKQCRICLKNGSVPIFPSKKYSEISEAIKMFGNIQINENDPFPKVLCDACYSLLQGAILFRKYAKKTESILLQNTTNAKLNIIPDTTYKDTICDISDNCNNFDEDKIDDSHKCKLCRMDFKTYNDYLVHTNSKQHRKVRVQCPICFGLLTAQLFQKHLARHQSVSHLICDVCGKLYRKDNLVRHLQLHSYDLPYQCQICPYRGRFMESLKIHMRTHSGDKPFSCDICNLKFLTRSNLNRHLLTHKKEKPFRCLECNRAFYTQRDVNVHFKSDHAGIKEYNCHMCGNKYGTRKAMMRHELRVHKRDKMTKGRAPLYLQPEFSK